MLLISYRKDINENKQYEYSFGILCVLSFLLAVSITFTDMFLFTWLFVMLLSVVSSVVGLMSSSKVFNGITLFLTIIFFLIFQVHYYLLRKENDFISY